MDLCDILACCSLALMVSACEVGDTVRPATVDPSTLVSAAEREAPAPDEPEALPIEARRGPPPAADRQLLAARPAQVRVRYDH